jgi:FtsP/CotA-like multicopper oxidase with cupredoxin domain
MSFGDSGDMHSPHWHGTTLVNANMRVDTISIQPGQSKTADSVANSEGLWLLHCEVNTHDDAGMQTLYRIE